MPKDSDSSFDDAMLMLGLMQESFVRLAQNFAAADREGAMSALRKIEAASLDDAARLARQRVTPPNTEALAAILRQVREMVGKARAGI